MCGIVGIWAPGDDLSTLTSVVGRMNRALGHRGPDDEGTWSAPGLALGHRRLSIIDLSAAARQPIVNEDGSVVLVANGEIYNFRSLREELEAKGHHFASRTDCEVILHLYEEYGDACVERLVGMFAFAVWDSRRRRLLLARDRIGEKPLYYARKGDRFAFASEIKGLLKAPWIARDLDREAVMTSLTYASIPAPLTIFKDIRMLPPASTLVLEDGSVSIRRYWGIRFRDLERKWTWDEALDEYGRLLKQSVEGCLISDVPLGVMLSGGVDSTTIALEASRLRGDLDTFCVGYDGDQEADPEFDRAQIVAEKLRTRHQNIRFEPLGLSRMPEIASQYDQPMKVFPVIYIDQLSRAISRHVKVVLSGNGGDEIFCGYSGYNRQFMARYAGGMMQFVPRAAMGLFGARGERQRAAWRHPIQKIRSAFLTQENREMAPRLLNADYLRGASDFEAGSFIEPYTESCAPRHYLDTVLYSDLMIYHQHANTVVGDISGMRYALEIRSPLLDHRIIEFAYSLPRRMCMPSIFNNRQNKLIMKRYLERDFSRSLIYASKMGMGHAITMRFERMMRGEWRRAISSIVRKGRHRDLGIFSESGIEWALEHSPIQSWLIFNYALWAEIVLDDRPPDELRDRIESLLSPSTAVASSGSVRAS